MKNLEVKRYRAYDSKCSIIEACMHDVCINVTKVKPELGSGFQTVTLKCYLMTH